MQNMPLRVSLKSDQQMIILVQYMELYLNGDTIIL